MTATLALLALAVPGPDPTQPLHKDGLSPVQIVKHVRAAGFERKHWATAVAVALAESRGVPNRHNGRGADDSYGLWQINVRGRLRSRVKEFGLKSPRDLFDPATNARAAYRISGGGKDWRPWSVYTAPSRGSNSYRRWLTLGRLAAEAEGADAR